MGGKFGRIEVGVDGEGWGGMGEVMCVERGGDREVMVVEDGFEEG